MQDGFPATESGPFGPKRYLTGGYAENERNTAPLVPAASCWCDAKYERRAVMDYFQYYFQHAYLVKRCQSEACFVCNALLGYDSVAGHASDLGAADMDMEVMVRIGSPQLNPKPNPGMEVNGADWIS